MIRDIVNNLNDKYDLLITEYKKMREQKLDIDDKIDNMKQALDFPWNFDESDIKELSSMLPSKYKVQFQNIKSYLRVLDKFPNQPQIVEVKRSYEEIKCKLIEAINEENNDFYLLFEQLEEKVQFLKTIIDDLSKYNNTIYLNPISLYKLTSFFNVSDTKEELAEFYEMILQNNAVLCNDDIKVDELENMELSVELKDFLLRLEHINESLISDTLEIDKMIYNFFNEMLESNNENRITSYKFSVINNILSMDIEDNQVLKRLEFLIHLYKVGIDLVSEQQIFIAEVKQFYYDKIKSSQKYQATICKNKKLINKLSSQKLYVELDLLNDVFSLNNISFLDRLKILSCIMYQNVLCVSKERDKIKSKKTNI